MAKTWKTTYFALLFLLVVRMAAAQEGGGVREAYLAKDDGKGKAGQTADRFSPIDVPIYAVVQLDSLASVTVKMDLVAVAVAGVKPETKVVSTSYTTKNGEDRVNFSGRPAGNWVVGKYRADIFVNGKLVKSLLFEVLQPGSATTSVNSRSKFRVTQRD